MIRKLVGMAAAFALAATVFAVVEPGVSSAAPLPSASGTVGCKIVGSGKFAPKLTLAGNATAVKIHFSATSNPTSGPLGCGGSATIPNSAGTLSPVNVTGVTITGAGYLVPLGPGNANKCSVFTASDTIGVIKVKYVWTAVPAIAPTVLTFTGGTAPIVSGSPFDTITLPAPSGTSIVGTGSFTPSTCSVLRPVVHR